MINFEPGGEWNYLRSLNQCGRRVLMNLRIYYPKLFRHDRIRGDFKTQLSAEEVRPLIAKAYERLYGLPMEVRDGD